MITLIKPTTPLLGNYILTTAVARCLRNQGGFDINILGAVQCDLASFIRHPPSRCSMTEVRPGTHAIADRISQCVETFRPEHDFLFYSSPPFTSDGPTLLKEFPEIEN